MIKGLTLQAAVEFAIKTEQLGQKTYRKLAERFSADEELGQIFTRLAKDEAVHEEQFRALLPEVPEDENISRHEERGWYLRAMSLSQFFMGEKGLLARKEDVSDRTDALVRAFEFEKSTVQYYQSMQEIIGMNKVLFEIIEMEKEHMMSLLRILMADAKFRGLADDF